MTNNKKFWISSLVIGIYILLSYLITTSAIKVILDFIVLIMCCEYILGFDKNI